MTDFKFANAEILFLLLALPVAGLLLSRLDKGAHNRLLRFMAEANLRQLLLAKGGIRARGKKAAFWLGLALLVIAAARPQANPSVEELQSSGLDIYVLLDVSRSMDVEDIAPSRLKKAKKTVLHLTSKLSGDRVGIIAYANSAILITPLTSDYSIIDSYLKNVDSSLIPSQGTNLGGALEVAQQAMERGAKSAASETDRSNIFLVLSDGEDHGESDLSIVDTIRSSGGLIFSIAYGTERGAPIPLRDEKGELRGYKTDEARNPVLSAMKPQVLKEAATRGGGHFYFSTLDETEIDDLLARVSDSKRGSITVVKTTVYEEWFGLFLAPGLLLLLFSYASMLTLGERLRLAFASRKKTPKGGASALAVLFLLLSASPAMANPLSFLWTKEKKASQESSELAKQKKYSEAVDALKGLQAENPDSPELNYNIGTYLIEEKKHEQGRLQLSRLRSADDRVRAPALFNTAGSYAQEGKKAEARAAYAELIQLLSRREKLSDEESKLLELAKKNVERLADPSQQPDQKQDKQEEKKEDGGEDKKEQKDQKGQKDQGGGDKPKEDEQKKQGEDQQNKEKQEKPGNEAKEGGKQIPRSGGQPFRERDNMGEDDAKRILGALKERESNLQKKFLKDKVKGGKVNVDDAAKDW